MSLIDNFNEHKIIYICILIFIILFIAIFITVHLLIKNLNSESKYKKITNSIEDKITNGIPNGIPNDIPVDSLNKIQSMTTFYKPSKMISVNKNEILNNILFRCKKYIDDNKNKNDIHALLLLAKNGEQLPINLVDELFRKFFVSSEAIKSNEDFTLILMTRLLYLIPQNNPAYNDIKERITKAWENTDFWLKPKETQQCFWSENHMICYLSTAYLWSQIGGKIQPIDKTEVEKLLLKYLSVKMKYGFYESFSQVYNMYTFSAILNIYDFSPENSELKILSKRCCDKLVQQFLSVTNSNGVVYCTQARAYNEYKTNSSNKNFNKFIYLYTNLNKESNLSPVGSFIATSKYLPDPNIFSQNYSSYYENVLTLSHSPTDFISIYKELSQTNRTLFQWSAGCYFNPLQIADTDTLLDKYDLWNHSHFKLESYSKYVDLFSKSYLGYISNKFDAFTEGSMLCNMKYHIYHHDDVILTSFENYNYGKLGAQQFPWVANVGGVPVFTQAGEIIAVGDLDEAIGNSNLPNISQSGPLGLIVYQPDNLIKLIGEKGKLDLNVYLHWPLTDFDENTIKDNWYFGRKENSYVAIYSSNPLSVDSKTKQLYNNNTVRQSWVVIVGTSTQYSDFYEFQNIVIYGTKISFRLVEKNRPSISNWFVAEYEYDCSVSFGAYNVNIKW